VNKPLSRREMFQIMAGLGLAACDTGKPNTGGLGAAERVNEKVASFLLSDREPSVSADQLTKPGAYPSYHIAPKVPIQPADWVLEVTGKVARPRRLSLDDLMKLPRTDIRVRHYCVEGWTAVAEWSGVRVSEIAKLVGAQDTDYGEFRSFDAPNATDRAYWSSWDRESAMHGQTILAYGMNGQALPPAYGAPLRLFGAVKLGYKNVKYLTEVNFLDRRTGGYWEDKGYEWFAGV
jgi:DMSO/TMAO reductase YedYZ molybdopterin-dependent catalytic subunit